MDKIKVLIVDDSTLIRSVIKMIISRADDIEIVGEASNGLEAIEKVKLLKPSVVTLDIEMPQMDGISAIPKLLEINNKLRIIMVSTLTKDNAPATVKALSLGASDYIEKPTSDTSREAFRVKILDLIHALGGKTVATVDVPIKNLAQQQDDSKITLMNEKNFANPPEIIVVASSTGGPRALIDFFTSFDKNYLLNKIVFVTQHMPEKFTKILANDINSLGVAVCKEGEDKEIVKPGNIYIAPGNYHMEVIKQDHSNIIKLNQNPPVNFCRPAADPMVDSILNLYKNFVFVILTGMGHDGCDSAKKVIENGGIVIAQDKESSIVWGMPGAAAISGVCTLLANPKELAKFVMKKG